MNRRTFIGLVTSASAMIASGVRVPSSVAKKEPTFVERSLDETIREVIGRCCVVSYEMVVHAGGPTQWVVCYRSRPPGSTFESPLDSRRVDWERLAPVHFKKSFLRDEMEVTWA